MATLLLRSCTPDEVIAGIGAEGTACLLNLEGKGQGGGDGGPLAPPSVDRIPFSIKGLHDITQQEIDAAKAAPPRGPPKPGVAARALAGGAHP